MYAREIDMIVKDLQLEGVPIEYKWYSGRSLRRGPTVGSARRIGGVTTVSVASGAAYRAVVDTIAHELRHVWQYVNDVYTYQWVDAPIHLKSSGYWEFHWKGSTFYPQPTTWRKLKYEQRPDEVDAFAYEEYAWKNIFHETPLPAPNVVLHNMIRGKR